MSNLSVRTVVKVQAARGHIGFRPVDPICFKSSVDRFQTETSSSNPKAKTLISNGSGHFHSTDSKRKCQKNYLLRYVNWESCVCSCYGSDAASVSFSEHIYFGNVVWNYMIARIYCSPCQVAVKLPYLTGLMSLTAASSAKKINASAEKNVVKWGFGRFLVWEAVKRSFNLSLVG